MGSAPKVASISEFFDFGAEFDLVLPPNETSWKKIIMPKM